MSSTFIILTDRAGADIYVRTASIDTIMATSEPDGSVLLISSGTAALVRESPDQVMARIAVASRHE